MNAGVFRSNNNKYAGDLLLYSLILIPFLKLLTSALLIVLPIYYIPTAIFTFILILKKQFNKKLFITVNVFLTAYIGINSIKNLTFTLPELKMYAAAALFLNAILVLLDHFSYNSEEWLNKKDRFENLTIWSGLIFMSICLVSFLWNQYHYPLNLSATQVYDFFSFSRSSPQIRLEVLLRFNPVGSLVNDIHNARYIGQQLLLLPLAGLVFLLNRFSKSTKSHILFLSIYTAMFLTCVYLTNSRAFALALIALSTLVYANTVSKKIHMCMCLAMSTFPILLFSLSSNFLSGRSCQISFVREHLTLFGNGIGAAIDDLNAKCQPVITDSKYLNIVTTSYDNIHLEFIHYFGIIVYIPVFLLLLVFALRHNNFKIRILFFLIFVFLALNFNLFEFSLLPVLIFLYLDNKFSKDSCII